MWWWAECCHVLWCAVRDYCPQCGRKGRPARLADLKFAAREMGYLAEPAVPIEAPEVPVEAPAFVSGRDLGDESEHHDDRWAV